MTMIASQATDDDASISKIILMTPFSHKIRRLSSTFASSIRTDNNGSRRVASSAMKREVSRKKRSGFESFSRTFESLHKFLITLSASFDRSSLVSLKLKFVSSLGLVQKLRSPSPSQTLHQWVDPSSERPRKDFLRNSLSKATLRVQPTGCPESRSLARSGSF